MARDVGERGTREELARGECSPLAFPNTAWPFPSRGVLSPLPFPAPATQAKHGFTDSTAIHVYNTEWVLQHCQPDSNDEFWKRDDRTRVLSI